MRVRAIIGVGREVIGCAPDLPIPDVIRLLVDNRIGALLVMDGDRISGVLSERDIVRCLAEQGSAALEKTARHLMTADVVTCHPDEPVLDALGHMTRRRFRHLPVIEDGRLVGIVSIGDLVKARIEEAEREAESLKEYIRQA